MLRYSTERSIAKEVERARAVRVGGCANTPGPVNNAFDASPAWEDITAQVAINRVYNFLNQSKTAEKWGVNVRFTIEKNEGYEGEVSISGFGGAYE